MKKSTTFAISSMLLLAPFMLFGCQGESAKIEDNMSEQTTIYYSSQNGNHRASISVGTRENPYSIDGYSQQPCDFSLINIKFDLNLNDNIIAAKITINDNESELKLDLNPISHSYMADLGYQLGSDDQIRIEYKDITFDFANLSKTFNTSGEEALSIAKEELASQISAYTKGKTFEGECYLKVLGQTDNFDNLFWCFTIEGRDGKTYNVIISVDDGSILQKTN